MNLIMMDYAGRDRRSVKASIRGVGDGRSAAYVSYLDGVLAKGNNVAIHQVATDFMAKKSNHRQIESKSAGRGGIPHRKFALIAMVVALAAGLILKAAGYA